MADELYALTEADLREQKEINQLVRDRYMPTLGRRPTNLLGAAQQVVGLLTDAVAATTGLATPPKAGTLNIYTFSSTGVLDTGVDETVFNFAPQSATTDRWTFASRNSLTGRLVIDFQACS